MHIPTNHYQVLNLNPHASRELVRAAYRSLSLRHHPDRNANSPESQQRMAEVNAAYEVLYHPQKRAQYDLLLAAKQASSKLETHPKAQTATTKPRQALHGTSRPANSHTKKNTHQKSNQRSEDTDTKTKPSRYTALKIGLLMSLCTLLSYQLNPAATAALSDYRPASQPDQALSVKPNYQRKSYAGNGEPWPDSSGYIPGYPQFNRQGQAQLAIQNTNPQRDIFAKLVHIYGEERYPVRVFYLAKNSDFTLAQLSPGLYQLQIQDLDSGYSSGGEIFRLLASAKKQLSIQTDHRARPQVLEAITKR